MAFDAADETPNTYNSPNRSSNGTNRLHDRPPIMDSNNGISIMGASQKQQKQQQQQQQQLGGFSIRGASTRDASQTVKELFPLKAGSNTGKELFAEKVREVRVRRRAEDMYF